MSYPRCQKWQPPFCEGRVHNTTSFEEKAMTLLFGIGVGVIAAHLAHTMQRQNDPYLRTDATFTAIGLVGILVGYLFR